MAVRTNTPLDNPPTVNSAADPTVPGGAALLILILFALAPAAITTPPTGRQPATLAPVQIDVNEADVHQLCLLPGVGPKTANAIVRDRRQNGRFDSIGSLTRVAGVGPSTICSIRSHVTIQPSPKWIASTR